MGNEKVIILQDDNKSLEQVNYLWIVLMQAVRI